GGPTPLGSLVLVALAPRSFAERDIRTLEKPLRELSRMIETVRRRGTGLGGPVGGALATTQPGFDIVAIVAERDRLREELAGQLMERAGLVGELSARSKELDELRIALDAASAQHAKLTVEVERARRDAERIELLSDSLAVAERERARLATALEAAAAERAEQARSLSKLEGARPGAEGAALTAGAKIDSTTLAAVWMMGTLAKRDARSTGHLH